MEPTVPGPSDLIFENGIQHPELYLWDAWSYCEKETLHLYCLALNRLKPDGSALKPSERNSFPFHIRHFSSSDDGRSWKDEGCFLKKNPTKNSHDSKTIWSGSIERLPDGRKLVAYTGIYDVDEEHIFLQNIALAISNDGLKVDYRENSPLSCPDRDYEMITKLGYYLSPPEKLGHKDGEGGGPILAWRDPFIFIDSEKKIRLFWAAKVGTHSNAMAHAILEETNGGFKLNSLLPPITLPDGEEFTQLELPKVLFDEAQNIYYLIVASCNRLYEGQSDEEVDKAVRLYKSDSLGGPWKPHGLKGSIILQKENLFGMTVLKADFKNQRLLCIAPFTDAASTDKSLTFSKAFYLYLNPVSIG